MARVKLLVLDVFPSELSFLIQKQRFLYPQFITGVMNKEKSYFLARTLQVSFLPSFN